MFKRIKKLNKIDDLNLKVDLDITEIPAIDEKQVGEAALRVLSVDSKEKPLSTKQHLKAEISRNVELALSRCEFETTPEIVQAIEGFYEDHLTLKSLIKMVVDEDYDSELLSEVLRAENYEQWEKNLASESPFFEHNGNYRPRVVPNAKVYSLQLAKYVNSILVSGREIDNQTKARLFSLAGQSITGLFTESSIGISTVDDEQVKEASLLADELVKAANSIGARHLFYFSPSNSSAFVRGSELTYFIEDARNTFWRDVRHAGSLLFHGSSNLGGINQHGLMSRNQQLRSTDEMNNNTALNFGGDTMHSVVPHFSEFYAMGEYSMGKKYGGTIAVPFIKVISEAPYARDTKYAVTKQKEDSNHTIAVPVLDRPIGNIGGGEPDYISSQGVDRVFFASADEHGDKLPDDYNISMFDKVNKPSTYIILRRPNHSIDRELHDLGYGDGFPERLVIDFPKTESIDLNERYSKQREDAKERIVQLQKKYLKAYKSFGVIVPLRRGVFAQAFENMPVDQTKSRARASIYNKYTPGTGKQV